jgi:hypothetical protein
MRLLILGFTITAVAGLSGCTEPGGAGHVVSLPDAPVHTVTAESGVVPPGTSLVIRTNDIVSTDRALRGTIYPASIAKDVLDQDGRVLIPKASPVELAVRPLTYLGPGGVGMMELALAIQAITVNGDRYPVATESGEPNAGGLGLDRYTPKWAGDGHAPSELMTRGSRINVPAEAVLAFQIDDPIRLKGYRQ